MQWLRVQALKSDTFEFNYWVYKLFPSKTIDSFWKLFVPHFPTMPIIVTPTSSQNLGCHLKPTRFSSCKSTSSPSPVNSTFWIVVDASSFHHLTVIALIQLLFISPSTIAQPPHCHFYVLVYFPLLHLPLVKVENKNFGIILDSFLLSPASDSWTNPVGPSFKYI